MLHATAIYVNFLYLTPNFFYKSQHFRFYTYIGLMLIVLTPIGVAIDKWLLKDVQDFEVYFYKFPHFGKVLIGLSLMMFVSSFWQATEERVRNKQLKGELKNYRLEAELKLLRMQVNPHFLFNALNNIYSMAFMGSKDTPETILHLSDMMRYILDSSNKEKMPLQQEIAYLQHYINLQQLKKIQKQDIELVCSGDTEQAFVEPMLFISLLENSFKHGNLEIVGKGWVKCRMNIGEEFVEFTIANTIDRNKRSKDKTHGIGLENVRQRLQLRYPNRHTFEVTEGEQVFTVFLKAPIERACEQ